jgi:enterochelin esterase family protein
MKESTVKRSQRYLGLVLFVCVAHTHSQSQIPTRIPNINDNLQSVEVKPDNTVTFKIYAPKTSSVTVSGDFLMGTPAAAMTKGDNGVWSFTSNVIPPDSYTYNFNVDGITVMDTKSPNFRDNPNSLFNFFTMPGPDTDFMALKDVPHGRVEKVIYHSTTLNTERRMHVYLPPDFGNIKGKLPVLYLLHGGGDNDISWTSAGQVNLILDNLYAEGKLKNMIVVMPTGHIPGPSRGMMSLMAVDPDNDPLAQDFLRDLVPFVQKTYPVSTRREDTAVAGFSMGGIQTLNLALWHPEMFGYVFPMSTGFFPDGIKQIDEKYSSVMKNVAAHSFKLMIVGRGKDDNLTRVNNQATLDLLDRYGIPHQYKELNGAHSFVFARRFLASVFPLLFR